MKTLKLIKFIIGLAGILLIVGVVIAIIVFVTLPEDKYVNIGEPHLEIKSESLSQQLASVLPDSKNQVMLEVKSLEMQMPLFLSLRIIIISFVIMVAVYAAFLLETFRKIIEDVEINKPFTVKNIQRVKRIGILITFAPIFEWLLHLSFSIWLKDRLQFDELKLVVESNLGWPVFLLGLLIIVLGLAFEQGNKMQEENELTI